ncbi:MAG: hypothetical protein ABS76_22835 [Pelagibacterium sp. SCN 64-44]|nr:MAG: hypothetical protein ABS76_22835 [Pelagibacterium sp. SCN 64-44]
MLFHPTSRRRLTVLAAACLLGTALSLTPAAAQALSAKEQAKADRATAQVQPDTPPEPEPQTDILLSIPGIETVGSNVDDATLMDILNGAVAENAQALAGLTAKSVTIPEISVQTLTTRGDTTRKTLITLNNLVLTDIRDGVAASLSLDGIALDAEERGHAEFGALSATQINIRAMLGVYGLVETDQTGFQTLTGQYSFAGGHLSAENISCEIGALSVGEVRMRPLETPFIELIALGEAMDAQGDDPSPALMGKAMRAVADILTAFETAPATYDGISCSGQDKQDRAMSFTIDGIDMGAATPGHSPVISMNGFDITVENDGQVRMGNAIMKSIDYSHMIETIASAPEQIDEAWLEAHAEQLVPTLSGFSFSDLFIDIPDSSDPDSRVKASIGAFDLSLGAYVNAIPSYVSTRATNIVVDLPAESDEEFITQLRAAGITTIDAGFALSASWNSAESIIDIKEFSVTGVDLGTVSVTATLTNATEALFNLDPDIALMASMALGISALNLDIADTGLMDIALTRLAAEQKSDAATLRAVYGGIAQGLVISTLAGAAEAQNIGTAIHDFVSGQASRLTIDLKAKDPAGLGITDFMEAEDNPASLVGKVDLKASAE